MKQDIFEYYAHSIAKQFHISIDQLFTKTKTSHIVDARQLLYLLCIKRNFKKSYIQAFCQEHGYNASHSTITYGFEQAKKLIKLDPDFASMVKKIQENDN